MSEVVVEKVVGESWLFTMSKDSVLMFKMGLCIIMFELQSLVSSVSSCDLEGHRPVGTCKSDMNTLLVLAKCWKVTKLRLRLLFSKWNATGQ
jgi:hypothetical protein